MGFNNLFSSRLQQKETRSESDLRGKGKFLKLMDRFLGQGQSAVQEQCLSKESNGALGEAFAGLLNELDLPSEVGFRLVVHGREKELKAEFHEEVYRIFREAIVNACRHSRATDIEMELEYRLAELRITVRDNGCGIDPDRLQWGKNGRRGLLGMRERAERIGAKLRLLSRVTLGTEVELRVPGCFRASDGPGWTLNSNALA